MDFIGLYFTGFYRFYRQEFPDSFALKFKPVQDDSFIWVLYGRRINF